jgi:RNA polymerase sigma factor (sigma-70 family)
MRAPRHGESDEELLSAARSDPAAFGAFYGRFEERVLRYFLSRVGDAEVAADLTAETFAAAIMARRRFRPGGQSAMAWLYGIANHKLIDFQRRGRAEERALHRLKVERRALVEEDRALIALLAEDVSSDLLGRLPEDERRAIQAHVLEDRSYGEIAAAAVISEPAARMRVSRGLGRLRARMRGDR